MSRPLSGWSSIGERVKLTQAPLSGQTAYQFVDAGISPTRVTYWLAEIDRAGTRTWHGPAFLPALRAGISPARAFPNPSRGLTSIQFSTPRAGPVAIEIMDLSGRTVRTVPPVNYDVGEHLWQWDGRDQRGARVTLGLYVFVIRSAEHVSTGKITMLR